MNRKQDPAAPMPADPRMAPEAGFEPGDESAAKWCRVLRELAVLEARLARMAEVKVLQRKRANAPGSRSVH